MANNDNNGGLPSDPLAASRASMVGNTVAVASKFVIQVSIPGLNVDNTSLTFSELTSITSEVEPAEYHASSQTGVTLSKQFGKTKPATVTLKRAMDDNPLLWAWHRLVIEGSAGARSSSCSLMMYEPGPMANPKATYQLFNAWPSKVDVTGLKAGASEIVYTTATLMCDQIVFVPTTAKNPGN